MEKGPTTDSVRCTAVCADGSLCRAWAVRGTDPPRCAPHGGGRAPVGPPEGNQNAQTHGFYARAGVPDQGWTIDTLVADLAARHAGLSSYIGRLLADDQADPRDVARLFALYRVSAVRLERLLQERKLVHRVEERLPTIVTQAGRPAAGKPAAGKPAAGKPAAGKPAAGKPARSNPAAGEPAADRPAASTSAAGEPAADRPAASTSAALGSGSGEPELER